jgi:hypothetical protein
VPGYAEFYTCGCGDTSAHQFWRNARIWWCGQCGSWRLPGEDVWRVPLEHARAIAQHARFVMFDREDGAQALQDERPTQPDLRVKRDREDE